MEWGWAGLLGYHIIIFYNASVRVQVANIYRHSSAYVWSDRVACTIHADVVPVPPAALRLFNSRININI